MELHPIFNRYPDLKHLVQVFRNEMLRLQRPATELILNDQDTMAMLKISKRKLDYLKSKRLIPYSQPVPRSSCYFLLSDLLAWLEKSRVESIDNQLKF